MFINFDIIYSITFISFKNISYWKISMCNNSSIFFTVDKTKTATWCTTFYGECLQNELVKTSSLTSWSMSTPSLSLINILVISKGALQELSVSFLPELYQACLPLCICYTLLCLENELSALLAITLYVILAFAGCQQLCSK